MEYQTLYRRFRPRNFTDFVGQPHVVTTLSHAIENHRLAHAYLFTGPRGTGKTSTAKIIAKALNCSSPQGIEPCDHCLNCTRINDGTFMDVLEIDAASNRGIDEIRDLCEKVKFAPAEGKYKIYIIDEVHMLTTEAFNALLKTLEEPPSFVVFILATTEVHKLPLTIISRCQRFDFKRFTIDEITGRLTEVLASEGVEAEDAALTLIAQYAEGGMRDALSLLEQGLAHCRGKLLESDVRAILGLVNREEIEKIIQALQKQDTKSVLTVLDQVAMDGKDLFQFGRSLINHIREMLLRSLSGETDTVQFSSNAMIEMIETLASATHEVKRSFQSALPLELALIKLTTPREESNLEARVARLETALLQRAEGRDNSSPAKVLEPGVRDSAQKEKTAVKENVAVLPPGSVASSGRGFPEWERFLEAVKNRKRTVAALVQEGKPLDFGDGRLIIGFPPHLKFHLDNLALPHNKELLESIIKDLYGQPIKISCIPWSPDAPKQAAVPSSAVPEALSQAVSLFGGEVQSLKEDKSK